MKHLPPPFLERPFWLQRLPEPQVGLVFATTLAGAILGALGGSWRARQDRRPRSAEAV